MIYPVEFTLASSTSSHTMDSTEEAIVTSNVQKGRRTKRQRHSPTAAAPATSSSSEEEDMANCLILLAQGPPPAEIGAEKIRSMGAAGHGKAGFFSHECRTCNRCFPSYQALGGHRTSHKKPKLPSVQEGQTGEIGKDLIQLSMNSVSSSNNGKMTRVHECLICGSEFSSGQALGGHMRRHRQTSLPEAVEEKKEKNSVVMCLDLNLPAFDDDDCCNGGGELLASSSAAAAETFSFASETPLMMSTSALVDCFY